MALSVIYDTEERQKVVDFVDYAKDGTGILVGADSPHKNLSKAELCGLSLGTIPGSTVIELAKDQAKKCVSEGKEPIELKVLGSNAEKLLAVRSGRIDVVTGDALQFAYLADEQPEFYRLGGEPLDTGIDGIALQKDSPLVPLVQKALQSLMDASSYTKLTEDYGFKGRGLDKATINLGSGT